VADAWVFATWRSQGADPVGSRTGCVRFELTRSDAAGRFSIPLPFFGTEPDVQVFMPKYKQFIDRHAVSEAEIRASNRRVELIPFAGTGEERTHLYNAIHRLRSCRTDDVGKLRPLYEAADREASELGVRPNFVRGLEDLQRNIELDRQSEERRKRSH
jgi:hypothetical protein